MKNKTEVNSSLIKAEENGINHQDNKDNMTNFVLILSPHVNNFEKMPEKNYNMDDLGKSQIEACYKKMNFFVEQLKVKLYYSNLFCLNWPSLKDNENYIYTKKTDTKDCAYYYCTEYSKCTGLLIIDLTCKESLNPFTLKFCTGNLQH